MTDGLDYAFRVRAASPTGIGTSSAQVAATAGCPCLTVTASDNDAIVGQSVQLTASVAPAGTEVSEYGWQRWFGEWRDVGPNSSSKGLKFNSSQTNKYRAVVTLPSGSKVVSGFVTVSWRLPEVTVIPSDRTPILDEKVTLTTHVESGGAGASAYQWQRRFSDWRDVGPASASKGLRFSSAGARTYRVVVTLSTGQSVASPALTLEWKPTQLEVLASHEELLAEQLLTLVADFESVNATADAYQWEYQYPGVLSWVKIGNNKRKLVISHGGPGTREYRVTVTTTDDQEIRSDPVTVVWKPR